MLDAFHVAFSRLKKRKVYVQHLIRERSKEVAKMILDDKAYIYVCGDASRMAKDVKNAIIDILALHNEKMDKKDAIKYVENMQNNGRYLQDIWSSILTPQKSKIKNKKNDESDGNDDSSKDN